jgi:D-glycero-D-manno-heptose 1,7-bisphosphate phosphatase
VTKPAVFLDRDGTIVEQVHHLCDPADIKLINGAADAIRKLRDAGFATVVVTNQSVIGRGMLTVEGLELIHAEMNRQLAAQDTKFDAIYFCPVAPGDNGRERIEHPDRKPGPGMLRRAAREMGLDLSASWMVGDMISDVLAGRNAGCRATILVRTGFGATQDLNHSAIDFVADDLLAAAELILLKASRTTGATTR